VSARARTLALVCPDWAITASGGDGGGPVAVVEAQRIVAASSSARVAGVTPGQRRREAQANCPVLVLRPRDRSAELRAFEPVVAALETFGAPVVVRRPGWAGFQTRGPARYFGGEEALARAVAAAVRALGEFTSAPDGLPEEEALAGPGYRVGIADGSFAATMAAWSARVVPSGETAEFLGPLPIEVLGDEELAGLLRRLGITTLQGFGALGDGDVLARFGPSGAHAHRLARGLGEPPPALGPRSVDRVVEAELDPPADRVDAAAFVARGLAETLGERLFSAGLACSLLGVVVETTEGERLSRLWSDEGPFSASLVAERLRWQLEAWLNAPRPHGDDAAGVPRGIERVRLVAEEVTRDLGRQEQLWGRPRAGSERATRVLARVQGMLGSEGVLRASLIGGRGPAERVARVPFGDPAPPGVSAAELPWPGRLPAPSPSVVPNEVVFVEVLDEAGTAVAVDARGAVSRPPAVVVLDGAPVPVASWAGPWPVDEQWWERATRRRRARFQVLLANGEAYLIALERGRFLLEGRYD